MDFADDPGWSTGKWEKLGEEKLDDVETEKWKLTAPVPGIKISAIKHELSTTFWINKKTRRPVQFDDGEMKGKYIDFQEGAQASELFVLPKDYRNMESMDP